MPKRYSGLDVVKILADIGYRQKHWKGGHLVMCHVDDRRICVVVPMHKMLKVGTALGILKRARRKIGVE